MSHDADAQAIERPVGGEHYRRPAEAWLENLDRNRAAILTDPPPHLREGRGAELARPLAGFLHGAELFGSNGGREWIVSHYLMQSGVEDSFPFLSGFAFLENICKSHLPRAWLST